MLFYGKGGGAWVGTNSPGLTVNGAAATFSSNSTSNWGWTSVSADHPARTNDSFLPIIYIKAERRFKYEIGVGFPGGTTLASAQTPTCSDRAVETKTTVRTPAAI